MNMIREAVESSRSDEKSESAVLAMMAEIINLLKNLKVVLDSGTLVGALAEKMDSALGDLVVGAGRSV